MGTSSLEDNDYLRKIRCRYRTCILVFSNYPEMEQLWSKPYMLQEMFPDN